MPQETTCILFYLIRVKQGKLQISFHELRIFDNMPRKRICNSYRKCHLAIKCHVILAVMGFYIENVINITAYYFFLFFPSPIPLDQGLNLGQGSESLELNHQATRELTAHYFYALEVTFLHKHLYIHLVLIMQNVPLDVPSNHLKTPFSEKLGMLSICPQLPLDMPPRTWP